MALIERVIMKTYKIQVFDKNGKQLYGLYADDSNREDRLAAAMKLHREGETTLIDEDITAEIEAEKAAVEADKQERQAIKAIWKDIQDPAAKRILKILLKDMYGK